MTWKVTKWMSGERKRPELEGLRLVLGLHHKRVGTETARILLTIFQFRWRQPVIVAQKWRFIIAMVVPNHWLLFSVVCLSLVTSASCKDDARYIRDRSRGEWISSYNSSFLEIEFSFALILAGVNSFSSFLENWIFIRFDFHGTKVSKVEK